MLSILLLCCASKMQPKTPRAAAKKYADDTKEGVRMN